MTGSKGERPVHDFRKKRPCEKKPDERTWVLRKPVFFVGFMGAGKTSVVRRLARIAGSASVDMDRYIERRCERKIAEIFAEEGEAGFRKVETEVLRELAAAGPQFISCGGGVVVTPENREILKRSGFVVHLQITAHDAAKRIRNFERRPLFGDLDNAERICEGRGPLYEEVADYTVRTADRSTGSVAYELRSVLRRKGVLWLRKSS